jgi:hypothetical protein
LPVMRNRHAASLTVHCAEQTGAAGAIARGPACRRCIRSAAAATGTKGRAGCRSAPHREG